MIDIFKDEPVSLRQATKIIPGNPSYPSIYRWAVKGRNGVRLETIIIGNKLHTTKSAIQKFFEAVTTSRKRPCGNPQSLKKG